MQIRIPELSVIVLIGTSGAGKSSFAGKHFLPTEILSSDQCRALVSDNENSIEATNDAFDLLFYLLGKRLKRGHLSVIDATNVQADSRKKLIQFAKQHHVLPVAIVLNIPEKICQERNRLRPDRNFGEHVIRNQQMQLRKSLRNLKKEGFSHVYILDSPEEVDEAILNREPLYNNLKYVQGPFDIIGDIHGCFEELAMLMNDLGYSFTKNNTAISTPYYNITGPEGRKMIFLGDLVDRGPDSPEVLKLVMSAVQQGIAYCVPGNHDMKLLKKLTGKQVQLTHGLAETMEQLAHEPPEFIEEVKTFLDKLISHYVLDEGKLVVAHAGLREDMQGRGSGAVRSFCLYGETTGETDEFGLPVRYNWAMDYRGKAIVVYGHTPVPEPEWLNRTINIDTGCVFGGSLTALRYPEREMVSVKALKTYAEPVKPIVKAGPANNSSNAHDDIVDIDAVLGKHIISSRYGNIAIQEENSIAALELMSRFAIDPKWLIYLPPTMSPSETSCEPDMLEHPSEALGYYRKHGVAQVVCEEKHMGSRAIVVVCRNNETARKRFAANDKGIGVCYTRTGRSFFADAAVEQEFLQRVQAALERSGFWERFDTDWVCLDAELMPWSAKAQSLLQNQYAAVGVAGKVSLQASVDILTKTLERNEQVAELLQRNEQKLEMMDLFVQSYRNYCWPVNSLDDYKLAPFHIMATEGRTYFDKPHTWHMEEIYRMADADAMLFRKTNYKVVDLHNSEQCHEAIQWWTEMTGRGGEGMVVKPYDFISKDRKGLIQPAVKCRGKEYLRIIYGPEYTAKENMERLKNRGLSGKRALAIKEFVLGLESLERFVSKDALEKVHECVFGVLALESEPIDPRL